MNVLLNGTVLQRLPIGRSSGAAHAGGNSSQQPPCMEGAAPWTFGTAPLVACGGARSSTRADVGCMKHWLQATCIERLGVLVGYPTALKSAAGVLEYVARIRYESVCACGLFCDVLVTLVS